MPLFPDCSHTRSQESSSTSKLHLWGWKKPWTEVQAPWIGIWKVQVQFSAPLSEGAHGNSLVPRAALCLCLVCWVCVGFFPNPAGLWGEKWKEEWPWAFQKALLTEISVLDTALLFICVENLGGFFVPFQSHRGSVPCASFIPSSFFFGGQGGTFSFSAGWMATLCSQGAEEVLPLGFSGIDDTLWMQI